MGRKPEPRPARLRTETSYKAGSDRRVSPTSRSRSQSTAQVNGELAQRKITSLSGEICTDGMRVIVAPASRACPKTRNETAKAVSGGAEVSRGHSSPLSVGPLDRGTDPKGQKQSGIARPKRMDEGPKGMSKYVLSSSRDVRVFSEPPSGGQSLAAALRNQWLGPNEVPVWIKPHSQPPSADPHARWCGEGARQRASLPD